MTKRKASTRRRPSVRKAKLPVTVARVRRLAFEYETLTEAAASLTIEADLVTLLDKHPELAAAWERGQMLRRLADCARRDWSYPETARILDMKPAAFTELLATDREAQQVWTETRLQTRHAIRDRWIDGVCSGKITNPAVISRVTHLLHSDPSGTVKETEAPNVTRVPVALAAQVVGITRQTLHTWHKEKGLARNSDGTYDLRVLVPFALKYVESKLLSGQGVTVTDLQRHERGLEIRARRLEREGYLLDSREVAKGLLAREQAALDAERQQGHDLAARMEGMTLAQRTECLREFFASVRRLRLRLPEQIQLPSGGREMLERLLTLLEPNQDAEEDKAL